MATNTERSAKLRAERIKNNLKRLELWIRRDIPEEESELRKVYARLVKRREKK